MPKSKPATLKERVSQLETDLLTTQVQLETLDNFIMYLLVSAMEKGLLSPEFILKQLKYATRNLEGKYRGFAKHLDDDRFIEAFEAEMSSDHAVPVLESNAKRIYHALKPFYEYEQHDPINLADDD